MQHQERSRGRSFLWVAVAYLCAGVAAFAVVSSPVSLGIAPEALERAALADLAATVVIFAFSIGLRNSSMYDAFWSVGPLGLLAYWWPWGTQGSLSAWLVAVFVIWWGLRLTWNWARGWPGLHHEDWRYEGLREKSGAAYPLVNFFGIHLFPTVQVFLGMLPVYWVLQGDVALTPGVVLAAVVTGGAVLLEQVADRQLLRFRQNREGKSVLNTGLWAWSRHPNYLGEAGFWWGLALFGATVIPTSPWCWAGAVAISAMFVFASIPMIEERHRERRPNYDAEASPSVFVPWASLRRRPGKKQG